MKGKLSQRVFIPSATLYGAIVVPLSVPGTTRLGLKLIADEATGLFLGAQAIGPHGAVSQDTIPFPRPSGRAFY
jgi:hypothetical protein